MAPVTHFAVLLPRPDIDACTVLFMLASIACLVRATGARIIGASTGYVLT